MASQTTVKVIGIGNPIAGDDAVGTHVIRRLLKHQMPGIEMIDAGSAGLSILNLLEGTAKAIIIDAFQSGRDEGQIIRLTMPKDLDHISNLAWNSAMASTHLIGLGEALLMGQVLGSLPPDLVIYGIELCRTETGSGLSVNVARAIEAVTIRIVQELEQGTCMNFK